MKNVQWIGRGLARVEGTKNTAPRTSNKGENLAPEPEGAGGKICYWTSEISKLGGQKHRDKLCP